MDFEEIGQKNAEMIQLVQDSDQWQALVDTVMNQRVP